MGLDPSLLFSHNPISSIPSLHFPPNLILITMPPKKGPQKETQTKLFSKEKIEEESQPTKSKSKQFSGTAQTDGKTSVHRWKYGTGKTPKNLTISSWNVNGIRSVLKKMDLQNYLSSLKPDILCLNETKIDEAAFDKDKI